ncbi:MAG: tetratricopeptide repeat protein [Phycisphaerae bacterium]|nr:tetratricopeptide repeat protein [Phycisphaerae bacterium]
MPIPRERQCSAVSRPSVSLPVLPGPRAVRRSKNGPRRAAVLVLVHVLIAVHIGVWFFSGMRTTISPLEPSEAMYTLNRGLVNAGFVLFVGAILSTAIFGRWFCGWACHIVALQDLCGWMMKRLGVRPRPFRTRLLPWATTILAVYMFLWPTIVREGVRPAAISLGVWERVRPFLGEHPPPVFRSTAAMGEFFKPDFTRTTDFWDTFPSWYVSIPFLLICGFATVYVLGNKGFCTYGCPYGGFFGPVDRVAPGRIRVNDSCEQCGHCTSVCTSNVRVHEEVRDYGMVVDPGCMKCLDCVSVCPNDALSFSFGRPAIGARPRVERPATRFVRRAADLTLRGEVAAGVLFLFLFYAYRGMLGQVPLLMAIGMAGIVVFLVVKAIEMLRSPSARFHTFQLRFKGRLRPAGAGLVGLVVVCLATAGWSATVHASDWIGRYLDGEITTPYERVFAAGYEPAPADKALAERAMAHLARAGLPRHGGVGWIDQPDHHRRIAWLAAVAGDWARAEEAMVRGIVAGARTKEDAPRDLLSGLVTVASIRGTGTEGAIARLRDVLALCPDSGTIRVMVAYGEMARGDARAAAEAARAAAEHRPADESVVVSSADVLLQTGNIPEARELLERASAGALKRSAAVRTVLGVAWAASGNAEGAIAAFRAALEIDPNAHSARQRLIDLLRALGREPEATALDKGSNRR